MGYWFVNTAGIGSLIVLGIGGLVLLAYAAMLRWVQSAPPAPGTIAPEASGEARQ